MASNSEVVLKIAVFGLGEFGSSVATALYASGADVLAVDRDILRVEKIKDQVSMAVSFDGTVQANLEEYEINHMDFVIVAIGDDFESSVLITRLCKELGVDSVISKALTDRQGEVLRLVGASKVIHPEEEFGEMLAEHILHESVVDFVELPDGISLRKIKLPQEWANKTIGELQLLNKGMNLVQVERADGQKNPLPTGEMQLLEGDILDVIAPDVAFEKYC